GPAWRARPAGRRVCSGRGRRGPRARIVDPCGRGVNKPRVASLPTSMQAVIADGAGGLSVVERALPQPRPGEVLIEVAAAGVNRPDILQRSGHYPPPPGAPDVLGLEV